MFYVAFAFTNWVYLLSIANIFTITTDQNISSIAEDEENVQPLEVFRSKWDENQ